MTKIRLFIATSLDGFIARENGSIDWLLELPQEVDHGYNAFISGIDIIVMGRKTYEDILCFGMGWPYIHQKTYVVTMNPDLVIKTPGTFLLHDLSVPAIEALRSESRKDIWLVGGGELNTHFMNLSANDEMTLCMIPRVLGKGIRLFPGTPAETRFELLKSEAFETGVVNLTYRKILA